MGALNLSSIPMTYIVLDIIKNLKGASWYQIERFAPMHPDFVDFEYMPMTILKELEQRNFLVTEHGEKETKVHITEEGLQWLQENDKRSKFREQYVVKFKIQNNNGIWSDLERNVYVSIEEGMREKVNHGMAADIIENRFPGCEIKTVIYC